jgi:hypothetical protein
MPVISHVVNYLVGKGVGYLVEWINERVWYKRLKRSLHRDHFLTFYASYYSSFRH